MSNGTDKGELEKLAEFKGQYGKAMEKTEMEPFFDKSSILMALGIFFAIGFVLIKINNSIDRKIRCQKITENPTKSLVKEAN